MERASEPLERRRSGGRPPAPDRGGRAVFGPRIERSIADLQARAPRRSPAGDQFDPHLVFKIPVAEQAPHAELTAFLESLGLTIVGIEPDKTIIAFKDDADLTRFREAAIAYQNPLPNRTTGETRRSTDQDVLEFIELDRFGAITPPERLGPRLSQQLDGSADALDPNKTYVLDVELWATGTREASERSIHEVEAILRQTGPDTRILDRFPGRTLCLAKIRANGQAVRLLLDQAIVAEVELPPEPSLISLTAERAIAQDLPVAPPPEENAPQLCIIDSGITSNHPLIGPHVGHEESVLMTGGDASDADGHGTRVAGVAIYGDVEECLRIRAFDSPIRIHSARILDDEGHFNEEELLINQLIRAFETFANPPHNCTIFNLSIGTGYASPAYFTGKQTQWAEVLDRVSVAPLKILIVVSAGNNFETFVLGDRKAEDAIQRYPDSLFEAGARLNDPATAIIPLVVGSLARSNSVDPRHDEEGSIVRPVAGPDEPSPFTRTGPGIQDAIKPDLVDYGGNVVLGRFAGGHGVDTDNASCILTTNRQWTSEPFAFEVGTSFAAPRVSRLAALVWKELQDQLDEPVTPNLVRAVLANSASVPSAAIRRLGADTATDERVLQACGYGRPDDQLALQSGDRTVTLIAQGNLELDYFQPYSIPIPDEFIELKGKKHISVSLAYDPPVRRRRNPYAGTMMQFDMLRGITIEEVYDAFSKTPNNEEAEPIQDARRIAFEPGINTRKRGTLQKGTFSFQKMPKYHNDEYWLVVRALRRWAPPDVTHQTYAIAVTLRADEPRLYNLVRNRLTARVRGRVQL